MTPSTQEYSISLTQGQTTVVDQDVFEWASKFKWHAHWDKHNNSFYAVRRTTVNGKRGRVFLHRAILGLSTGDKRQGDHRSRNTLDNRIENLRVATPAQNTQNSKLRCDNKTGYKGVRPVYGSKSGRWMAQIICNKKRYYLGTFANPREAGESYRVAALRFHGEFARMD